MSGRGDRDLVLEPGTVGAPFEDARFQADHVYFGEDIGGGLHYEGRFYRL